MTVSLTFWMLKYAATYTISKPFQNRYMRCHHVEAFINIMVPPQQQKIHPSKEKVI